MQQPARLPLEPEPDVREEPDAAAPEPASAEFAASRAVYGPDRRRPLRRRLALLVLALLLIALATGLGIAFVVDAKPARADATPDVKGAAKAPAAVNPLTPAKRAVAELPRRKTRVLVLNGLGASGAAQAAADRLGARKYVVVGADNAPFAGYRRTVVLYRKGFRGEAERLARDLGLKARRVAPVDGIERSRLRTAQLVLILGG